jgi:ribosomal protein S18 acetylase RimI-like enzyme
MAVKARARTEPPPAFALPAALIAQNYRLRAERDDDIPFLMALYASTREAELAPVPWSAEQKAAFLASQFEAQRVHYRKFFPATAFDVIERDGVPVGRLYVDVRVTHIHVIDIALLPGVRGQGVGTALMRALQDYARDLAMGLDLFVEKFNPALRLYRRLGFAGIADHDVQIEMEWLPQLNKA